jgi:hypothetical protein
MLCLASIGNEWIVQKQASAHPLVLPVSKYNVTRKVWKLATFLLPSRCTHNITMPPIHARNWIDTLGLHDELKECSGGSRTEPAKEKGLVEYWF